MANINVDNLTDNVMATFCHNGGLHRSGKNSDVRLFFSHTTLISST